MTFTSEVRGGICIIKISGTFIFDESLFSLRPKIRELLQSGIRAFVLDLSGVPHCDSSGCGEIIGAYTTIRKADARVAFINPGPRVRLLWERIKITDIFEIFDTLKEAEDAVRQK